MSIDNEIPKGWRIDANPSFYIPSDRFIFLHEDYDYCSETGSNGLCGTAESIEDAIEQIKEIEAERG